MSSFGSFAPQPHGEAIARDLDADTHTRAFSAASTGAILSFFAHLSIGVADFAADWKPLRLEARARTPTDPLPGHAMEAPMRFVIRSPNAVEWRVLQQDICFESVQKEDDEPPLFVMPNAAPQSPKEIDATLYERPIVVGKVKGFYMSLILDGTNGDFLGIKYDFAVVCRCNDGICYDDISEEHLFVPSSFPYEDAKSPRRSHHKDCILYADMETFRRFARHGYRIRFHASEYRVAAKKEPVRRAMKNAELCLKVWILFTFGIHAALYFAILVRQMRA